MTDLIKDRAALARQLDNLERDTARLASEMESLPKGDSRLAGAPDRLRAMECDAAAIKREMSRIDHLIAWQEATKNADIVIKAATKEITAARKALVSLDADHGKLASKVERLRAEADEILAATEEAAEAAANEYAAAAVQGGERAESAAMAKLEKANDAAEVARRKVTRQQAVITAMSNELDAIEQRRAIERERLELAEQQRLDALILKAQAEWDAAAASAAKVAEKLVALEMARGGSYSLGKLYLPMTDKLGAGSITEREVRRAAEVINVAELIG